MTCSQIGIPIHAARAWATSKWSSATPEVVTSDGRDYASRFKMALLDQIKARMFQAMKAGNVTEREILKVAMGEITTDAARPGRKGDDAETLGILKKLVKSNEE